MPFYGVGTFVILDAVVIFFVLPRVGKETTIWKKYSLSKIASVNKNKFAWKNIIAFVAKQYWFNIVFIGSILANVSNIFRKCGSHIVVFIFCQYSKKYSLCHYIHDKVNILLILVFHWKYFQGIGANITNKGLLLE